jgi:hypothetical protein
MQQVVVACSAPSQQLLKPLFKRTKSFITTNSAVTCWCILVDTWVRSSWRHPHTAHSRTGRTRTSPPPRTAHTPEAGVLDEPYLAKPDQRRPARLHRMDTVPAYGDWRAVRRFR